MAKIKPLKKKEPLDPETALTVWQQTVAYVHDNIRQIGALALIGAVVIVALSGWMVSRNRAEQEALSLFSQALAMMEKIGEKQGDNATTYEAALEKFKTVHQQHPSTKAGKAALFYSGVCYFHLKKYDEAITSYKNFLDSSGSTLPYLKAFTYEGLGYAHEMKNQYAEAITWFERQKQEGSGALSGTTLLNLARCYEAQGDKARACTLYQEFLEKQPNSSFKDLAKLKTATVCTKAPAATEAPKS